MRRIAVFILIATALAGCGFQLQGQAGLPPEMERTRLDIIDPYSPFSRRLQTLLEQNGAHVVSSEFTAILEVPVDRVRREILTIGDNARVREYRVSHQVQFRLLDGDGNELMPSQSFEQSRVINFDERDVLAASREEEFLEQDLADALSRMVLRHLASGTG